MVKISIFYPHSPGSTFDMEYYLRTHMPMSLGRLGTHPGFIALSVERGVEAPQSGAPPAFVVERREPSAGQASVLLVPNRIITPNELC